jgi:hypothetical protein
MKMKLTVQQAITREGLGLSMKDVEIIPEPKPVVKNDSQAIQNLRLQEAAGIISFETFGRKLLQEMKTPGGSCSCSGACSCSFQKNEAKSLLEASCKDPIFAGSKKGDLDVIAICDDGVGGKTSYLVDHKRASYFRVDFEAGVNEPTIVGVEPITPENMVKQNGGFLHEIMQLNLTNPTPGVGRRVLLIAEHLLEHEGQQLLLG